MDTPAPQTPEVDLHRLDLRFADARLLEPRAIEALARSIEQSGQLIACIAVPEADSNRLILVDGYRAKNGSNRANGRDVTFPDGRKLFMGSSGTGAPRDGRDASEK